MTVLLVLLMVAGFVVVDLLIRKIGSRLKQKRIRREREAVLKTPLRLEFAEEVASLQRAEVPEAKARILVVDDEPVVLDSLRKILVLDGYSVDTVESGPEALSLARQHDYDFVFTDLKMPGMDGVEVVKAVHHLRPDTDIAVITGYATIESAVETMQHGAVAYIQKPFTADELSEFAKTLRIKRQARLEAQRRPPVRVVVPTMAEEIADREFCVPGGAFLSAGHAWVRLERNGQVRVGLDDFARKALGRMDGVQLPEEGKQVRRGETLFSVTRGSHEAHFKSPVSGQVRRVNTALHGDTSPLERSPYERGWICLVEPTDVKEDVGELLIGQPVVAWYQQEIERLFEAGGPAEDGVPAVAWEQFERRFLASPVVARP